MIARRWFPAVALTLLGCRGGSPKARDEPPVCFDVAVAVLKGGVVGSFSGSGPLTEVLDQALAVDPARVTARGFDSEGLACGASRQIPLVRAWLDGLNRGCPRPPKVILVGHSLGGDSVRQGSFAGTCVRIALDPIDPCTVDPLRFPDSFNQRDETRAAAAASGRTLDVLAGSLACNGVLSVECAGLLGYHIAGAEEIVLAGTDHCSDTCSVVREFVRRGIAADEVRACLAR